MERVEKIWQWCRVALEYFGGAVDEPPAPLARLHERAAWGLWWAVLLMIIILFCGQTSKFIYIDF